MSGSLGHIGIGLETTWGTGVAAADYIEALSESIITTTERFETRNMVGAFYEGEDAQGIDRHEGDLVFFGHPESMGHALKGCLGSSTVTSLDANLKQNVFKPATSNQSSLHPLPPYTLEVFRPADGVGPSSSFRYSGAQFASVELSIVPNQEVRVSASVIAKTGTAITKTSPSFPGSPTNAFTFDTGSISLGGTGLGALIEAFTVTFDNQLQGTHTIQTTRDIAKVSRSNVQLVGVSGTLSFSDFSHYDAFRNETEQQLLANFTKANSFSLLIDLPRFIFTEYPVQVGGRDRVTVDFVGKGRYNVSSATAIQVTLTTISSF